jgi:hypothetical protein
MAKNLFVLVPGFGHPEPVLKAEILKNNIRVIESYPWDSWQMTVCKYSPDVSVPSHPKITVIEEPGIVGQFIKRHANPESLKKQGITHILLVLDDIELVSNTWDWSQIFKWMDQFVIDILSPAMSPECHTEFEFLKAVPQRNLILKSVRACEFFCYFMPIDSYAKYYPYVEEEHPWMWGMDLCLWHYFKLRTYLMNNMIMRHYIVGKAYSMRPDYEPFERRAQFFEKHGIDTAYLASQQAIEYCIVE